MKKPFILSCLNYKSHQLANIFIFSVAIAVTLFALLTPMSVLAESHIVGRIWRGNDSRIYYITPENRFFSLDLNGCQHTPICSTDYAICCDKNANSDSELQFTLKGSPSIGCTLLHFGDRDANNVYFGTGYSNSCVGSYPCFHLREEGSKEDDFAVDRNEAYEIMCVD